MSASGAAIGLYYLALCGAMGLYLPYLSSYLSSVGLSDRAAVQVHALVPFMSLFVPPLLGLLADARRARIWLLRSFSAASAVTFAALGLVGGHAMAIAVVLGAFALARSPLMAFTDATAHEHVRHHGGSYGRLRLWGSIGYLTAVLLAGALYDATSIRLPVWATTVAFAILAICAWRMPAAAPRREVGLLDDVVRMLRTRPMWLFLAAVAAAQAAAACYDTTLVLHLTQLGHGKNFVGLVIAIGVGAETILIAVSGRILTRFRVEHTLVVAFSAAIVRWIFLSNATSPVAILAQAPLHAISFGLYWVSATTLIREYAGPRAAAAGQGLLGAATSAGSILGNLSGGPLFARGGGHLLFAVAAGFAAVATGFAAAHAVARRRAALTPSRAHV
jgi:MFS transporter, PPP family, 3-phenylpropionic acid transporter